MHAYFVSEAVTISTPYQAMTRRPPSDIERPKLHEMFIASQNELELVRSALKREYPDVGAEEMLHILTSRSLEETPVFPAKLGKLALLGKENQDGQVSLRSQLEALRSAHPQRRRFRILLVNGFGSNLGDNLVGLSAFAIALAVMRSTLPDVTVDVQLGWNEDDRLERLYRDAEGIENILTQGISVAELSRYQGVFDTSSLLFLPGYGTTPIIDWHLEWMGIDSAEVDADSKRNRIAVPDEARRAVTKHLSRGDGPLILINPKASVPLRSMPESAVRRFAEYLLEVWPKVRIGLVQPMDFNHPRVEHLYGILSDIDRLAVLLEQSDGIIGVDTYTQHLADALSLPAVTLYTSVLPDLYPYYPLVEPVLLPDAHTLPAWGTMKTSKGAWKLIAHFYESAWEKLDPDSILTALWSAMARKSAFPDAYVPRLLAEKGQHSLRTRMAGEGIFAVHAPRERRDENCTAVMEQMVRNLALQVLVRGDSAVVLGAGVGETAVGIARIVGAQGEINVFEPRHPLHQRLCSNLMDAGISHVRTYPVLPIAEEIGTRELPRLYAEDDYLPQEMGNSSVVETTVCFPLDRLKLKECRFLGVYSPVPLLLALEGSRETIIRSRPVIVAGIFPLERGSAIERFFDGLGYRVKILEFNEESLYRLRYAFAVAQPIPACH